MCGIVGYVGQKEATALLLEGLRRLEYRGYDSAGLATASRKRLHVTKVAGRVEQLRDRVGTPAQRCSAGIAHTRWATHGPPTETNAHPHVDTSRRIAVVHNGILENAELLRARLADEGVELVSDTDTETLAHMIAAALDHSESLLDATRTALVQVEGTYGLLVYDAQRPDEIVAARNGSPVILGVGDGETYIASDVSALVQHTQQVVHLGRSVTGPA